MNKKYLLKSGIKIARISRLIAKAIDLSIVLICSPFFYPLGLMIGTFYLMISDSIQNGQSVGKKFIGFAVVSLEDGKPCSAKQSLTRNLPLIIPCVLMIIPLWGWILALLLGIPLVILETYLLFKLDSGHRLGDVMADTTVIANDPNRLDLRKKQAQSWFKSSRPVVP